MKQKLFTCLLLSTSHCYICHHALGISVWHLFGWPLVRILNVVILHITLFKDAFIFSSNSHHFRTRSLNKQTANDCCFSLNAHLPNCPHFLFVCNHITQSIILDTSARLRFPNHLDLASTEIASLAILPNQQRWGTHSIYRLDGVRLRGSFPRNLD